jgi:hypothetical protein
VQEFKQRLSIWWIWTNWPAVGATEEYDGATWTSNPTGLNTARVYFQGAGTQTAALGAGGYTYPPATNSSNRRI